MTRTLTFAGLALCCAILARAQETKPRTPHTFDRQFVLFEAGATASELFDAETTRRGLNRGCLETSPLYGPHPSTARLYGEQMGLAASFTAGEFLLKKLVVNHPAWAIFPSLRMVGHGVAAWSNAGKDCR